MSKVALKSMLAVKLIFSFTLIHYVFSENIGVPVLILDQDDVLKNVEGLTKANPIEKIDSNKFIDVVNSVSSKCNLVIVFVEEHFSIADISSRDLHGSPYKHIGPMMKARHIKYLPSVEKPYEIITTLLEQTKTNTFPITNIITQIRVYPHNLNNMYIVFSQEDTKRIPMLRQHDSVIAEVYSVLRKSENGTVCGFYTGKKSPPHVDVRPVEVKDRGHLTSTDGGMMYMNHVVHVDRGTKSLGYKPELRMMHWTNKKLHLELSIDKTVVRFLFSFSESHWTFDDAVLYVDGRVAGKTRVGVGAPHGYSTTCSHPIVVSGAGVSVTIGQYQVEAYKPSKIPHRSLRSASPIPDPVFTKYATDQPVFSTEASETLSQSPNGTVKVTNGTVKVTTGTVKVTQDHNVGGGEGTSERAHERPHVVDDPNVPGADNDREGSEKPVPGPGWTTFSPSVTCTICFTVPILACTMISLLCLGILSWGLLMMLDLRAYDRFDDPHGKTLQIQSFE